MTTDDNDAIQTTERAYQRAAVDFYLAKLSDRMLVGTLHAFHSWAHVAPALCTEVTAAAIVEINRRQHNHACQQSGEVPQEPELFALRLDRWSDRDVAEGLLALTAATYGLSDVELGSLCDSLTHMIAQVAADRLVSSHDPRNDVSYLDRELTAEQRQAMIGGTGNGTKDPE